MWWEELTPIDVLVLISLFFLGVVIGVLFFS